MNHTSAFLIFTYKIINYNPHHNDNSCNTSHTHTLVILSLAYIYINNQQHFHSRLQFTVDNKPNIRSCGEDGREDVGLAAEHLRLGVRELLCHRRDLALVAHNDRVRHEVPREVALERVAREHVPVPLRHLVHPAHAIQPRRPEEEVSRRRRRRLAQVLLPQRDPEAVDLPPRRPGPGRQVARLVRAHGDLRVAAAVHGALVDVRRPHDDVLVVDCKAIEVSKQRSNNRNDRRLD